MPMTTTLHPSLPPCTAEYTTSSPKPIRMAPRSPAPNGKPESRCMSSTRLSRVTDCRKSPSRIMAARIAWSCSSSFSAEYTTTLSRHNIRHPRPPKTPSLFQYPPSLQYTHRLPIRSPKSRSLLPLHLVHTVSPSPNTPLIRPM